MKTEVNLSRWDQGDGKHCIRINTGRHTAFAVGCYDHCPGMYNDVSFFDLSVEELEQIGRQIIAWAVELRCQEQKAESEGKQPDDGMAEAWRRLVELEREGRLRWSPIVRGYMAWDGLGDTLLGHTTEEAAAYLYSHPDFRKK